MSAIGVLPKTPYDTVYGLDSNWQIQNAFEYYMRERRPGIAWFTTDQLEWLQEGDRLKRFNAFVSANEDIGRSVLITDRAFDFVHTVPQLRGEPGPERQYFPLGVKSVATGTPYVLAFLRSDREYPPMAAGLGDAWRWLAPGIAAPPLRNYTVIVGRVGGKPVLVESQDRPYRVRVRLAPFDIDVRMESWLPTDTIRRAGFGHVVVNREHALTLERGISFVGLGPRGAGPIYGSGLFAPIPRHVFRPNP